jgi:demethylmenaquinone methyltransferase/2-methoxy-6-polyprenyl-1,4-benzoquinol methylase
MTHLTGSARSAYVQALFTRIARRYDLLNRLMTAGQDVSWRREVIRRAAPPAGARLLDLGAGTGDLALEALRQSPACRPVAADFTLAMLQVGRRRRGAGGLAWTGADALRLPFPAESFAAVVSGYLLRNVVDLPQALAEQRRVLQPGGRLVCLDTTRPRQNILYPFIQLHLHIVIPALGRLLAGQAEAYTYLPDSTEDFLTAEQLATRLTEAGFREVSFRRVMFGTMAIHWGVK